MACRANDCHFNIFQLRKTKSSTKDLWVMTSVETLGYYQESLRDEDEIVV